MKRFAIAALLAAFGMTTPLLVRAQEPPANTYQPGFWQPVARYDATRSARIRLVNRTDSALQYNLTSELGGTRRLFAGESVILSNVEPDSYVIVYSEDKTEQAGFPVRYRIAVSDNLVTVDIVRSATALGEQTVHLHPNGGIFVY
ncbi:hypothetical protein [Oscillatoria sp. FACHB-1406]|uniref:hypothetical protein n=1 Tax=Oscillatoria sp. FACHB-1406 TaxID=2692846 RepID=UPI0016888370|nr:hypothetical protein [Oscillatoria sp. FACHB-1406]MBD2578108.1 hypothetical protein [Oscillatoria sp. FACHB-1406]